MRQKEGLLPKKILKSPIFLKSKKYIGFLFGVPLTLLAFFFVINFLYSSRTEFFSYISELKLIPFLWGTLFLLLFFSLKSKTWQKLLEREGFKPKNSEGAFLYSYSELRRYIPLNILSFATRVDKFEKYNIPKKSLITFLAKEAVILVASAGLVSIPGFIYVLQLSSTNSLLYFLPLTEIGITLSLASLLIFASIFFLNRKRRILSFLNLKHLFFKFYEVYFLSVLSWVFFAIGNLLIAVSFHYFSPFAVIPLASFFVFSWLVGYLSFVVPMGLGVREGLVVYGLSYLSPVSLAVSLAIILRVALVFSELIFFGLSYFFLRMEKQITKYRTSGSQAILAISIFTYSFYFSFFTFKKHINFFTGRFDLGNMDQTVWNTMNGRIFELTNPDSTNITSRLGTHADFILVLISPLYFLWQDPRMLLFIQTITLSFGAIFVYLIGKLVLRRIDSSGKIALILSVSYLLNPFIQKQNLFDFHAVTLATTFLLGSFYFLLRKNSFFFLFFLTLAVLTKENIYLIAFLFGIYSFFKLNKKLGLSISLFSLIAFYLLVSTFIPEARGGQHFAVEYFQEFGDSPMQILKGMIIRPDKAFLQAFSFDSFDYFFKLFSSTGFLSFAMPFSLVFALPDLALNFLSKNGNFRSITFHYQAAIIPFIYISAIYGIKKVLGLKKKYLNKSTIFYYILASSLVSAWMYGPLPGSNHPSLEIYAQELFEKNRIESFLKNMPKEFSITSSNNLGAHLSHRKNIYTIPNGIETADMVLFLLNDPFAQPSPDEQRKMVRQLKNNKNYVQVAKYGDFIAFQRKSFIQENKNSKNITYPYPYSISTLQKRSYQKGRITFEKTLTNNENFQTDLISYFSDGYRIFSLLSYPKNYKQYPPFLVIMHDLNDNYYNSETSLKSLVETYSQLGFIVLRPDFKGFGKSEGSNDASDRLSYPVDLINLVFSMDTQNKILGNNFNFLAYGDGNDVVLKTLEVAGQNPNLSTKIEKSVLINPTWDTVSFIKSEGASGNLSDNEISLIQEVGSISGDKNLWEEINPKSFVDSIDSEIMIIDHTTDPELSKQSITLFEALKSNNLKVFLSKVESGQSDVLIPHISGYLTGNETLNL